MNSLQRVLEAVDFGSPDRVPVIPQIFGHAAILAGVTLEAYARDGGMLARCQLEALSAYGHDAVFALMGATVEAEALGSKLRYSRDNYPYVESYALRPGEDWDRLELPDPQKTGRMPQILEALRILRGQLADSVPVVGCVLGPLTLVTQLLGMETALLAAIDETSRFTRLLDFATEVVLGFGLAQMTAGAHFPLIFDPSATPEVVPRQFFREFELPRLKRLALAFKEAGAPCNWLHIAGDTSAILPLYSEIGADIANFDCPVGPSEAAAYLPRTCLDGNIKTLDFVCSSPALIQAESCSLIRSFDARGGFILSSGCEIPLESLPENIAAMVHSATASG